MDRRQNRKLIVRRLFAAQLGILVAVCVLLVLFLFFTGQLGSFPFSFLAGCLGGSIALVRRLPKLDDPAIEVLAAGPVSTMMPLLYGGFMGGVTYLLFMSGMLTGDSGGGLFTSNLFPNFTRPETDDQTLLNMRKILELRPGSVEDFGKLIVWCFLSGYSERFVSGVLGALEDRSGSAERPKGE